MALRTPPASASDSPRARVESGEARPLRVCLVPFYHDNPYQQQLVDHLGRLGILVTTRERLKGLVRDVRESVEPPDVVHLHWLPGFDGKPVVIIRLIMFMLRVMLLRWQGVRIVWTVHNLYAHEGSHRWVERLFIRDIVRCSSRLIVHSRTAAQIVRREFAIRDQGKLVVIPHGHYLDSYPNTVSQAEARRELGLPPDQPVLLFLGKIRPYKGVLTLVRTFQMIAPPTATLLVAGSPNSDEIIDEIRAEIRGPNVRLEPGYVPDERVQVYMNAADAVVFPYQDVLTSGAVILAMSFGKAGIAARLGCICDVLDESGGLLYDARHPDGLRSALQTALEQPERLKQMGHYNRERARAWNWETVAQATKQVYDSVGREEERTEPGSAAATYCS